VELARELQRFLADEPVSAWREPVAVRARRWARRHRTSVTTAAALLVAGLVGVSAFAVVLGGKNRLLATSYAATKQAETKANRLLGEVTQERNVAHLARQEADRRASEATEVVDFLINDLIGAAAPSKAQGKIATVDQVLARADERITQKFADRPLIEASIRHTLGKAYEELGQYKKAEEHAARAVELRLAHLGPAHVDTIDAQNALGWALVRQGKNEEARTLLTPVLETARKTLGPEHTWTLQTIHTLAPALFGMGKYEEERTLLEDLLAIRKRVQGPEHSATLATIVNLAGTYHMLGKLKEAKQLWELSLAVDERDRPNHPNTLMTMSNLALVYRELGQDDRAIDMRRRVVEARVRVLGLTHPFTQQSIGSYFEGSSQMDRGHREEARNVLEALLDRSRSELGPEAKPTISLTGWLADTLCLLGQTEKAVALVEALPESRDSLDVREELARYLYLLDARGASLVQFQRVEAVRPRLVPADDAFGLRIRARLAQVLREDGRFDEARSLLEQVVAEAVRLRDAAPKPDQQIEEMHAFAQFLLSRWPGLAPGSRPEERPPASFVIEAPFRADSPVADGQIAPGEYGPGVEATFDDGVNHGRLWAWGKSRSKTPDDLSVRVHAAYTDRSLFLAFRVRDQFVSASEENKAFPYRNDDVEVFINGDQVANDLTFVFGGERMGNREGFQIDADAGGHQFTLSASFKNADWKVGTSRTPVGYVVEFEIPLALIDTRDGPEFVPATSGSELLVNFGFNDADGQQLKQTDYAIFWAEDPRLSPLFGGEDFWTVKLRLVPDPTSQAAPGSGR
jgi:tetratricopeptide (TPR) repeat protein